MVDPQSPAASGIVLLKPSECLLGSCYRFVGKIHSAASDVVRITCKVGRLTAILDDPSKVFNDDSSLN